jgi:hypothetical protein
LEPLVRCALTSLVYRTRASLSMLKRQLL